MSSPVPLVTTIARSELVNLNISGWKKHTGGVRCSEGLGAQPLSGQLRSPLAVEATENRHGLAFDHEVHQAWEPAHNRPPDVAVHLWVEARIATDSSEEAVDDRDEAAPEADLLCFVPLEGLEKVELGERSNNEAELHLARSRRARTSGQGLPASG